jgi:hypothetical protein
VAKLTLVPPLKRAIPALLAIVASGALVLVLVAAYSLRSLDRPEARQALLERAGAALGAPITARSSEMSLFSGLRLQGVSVGNPPPFKGELLTADAFVLRYRLLPLLRGRLEVQRLSLDRPSLRILSSSAGGSNLERLLARPPGAGRAQPRSGALKVALILSQLSVKDGAIHAADPQGATLIDVEGAHLTSGFELSEGRLEGSGKAKVARARLANGLGVSDLEATLQTSGRELRLSPIHGKLAGGDLEGEVTLSLTDRPYTARIEVKGAAVETFLAEINSVRSFSGDLEAKAGLEGTGGLPTLKGKGQAQVAHCKVEHDTVLSLLAATLAVPELARPELEQCKVEFTLARSVLTNPLVSLRGPALQMSGHGTTHLESHALDYEMTLALKNSLLQRVPAKEMRAAFRDRGDGFATIDFKVAGTASAPETDLLSRLGKAAATEAAKGGLQRLLERMKKKF